jgi:putative NADH-flavin reductase
MSGPKAGGNIGSYVLKALENRGLNLTVLTRPTSTSVFASGIKVIRKEYSDTLLYEAFLGQDVVISLLGGTAILDQTKLIDASVKAGVKRFIPSEFGSNSMNKTMQDLAFFYKQKTAVIDHLKLAASSNPSFSWTGIATGPLIDMVGTSLARPHYPCKCEAMVTHNAGAANKT